MFVLSIIFVGLCEAFSWLVAIPNSQILQPFSYLFNALFLTFNTLPVAYGLRYLDYKIFFSIERNKNRFFIYLIPVYINIGFMIINIFFDGFLFQVDSANEYHRGIATYIGNLSAYITAGITYLYFFKHKKMITGRITQAIIVLIIFPMTGAVLQMLFFGLSLGIPSYTLAVFICFLLLERDEQLKDPLTKLSTRTLMERRLEFKLKSQENFTVFIIDINDFKKINDTY
jgi:hypothetical protein